MTLTAEDLTLINALYARYNTAIDTGDGAGFAACFTPDGHLDTGMGGQTGTEAIAAFGTGTHETLPGLRHQSNNIVVDGDGSTASGGAFLVAYNVEGGYTVMATGRYTDELAKTDAGWRFTSRVFVAD